MVTKACIACAEEILDAAKLCKHCGTLQEDTSFISAQSAPATQVCVRCNEPIDANAKRCGACGQFIYHQIPAIQPAPVPTSKNSTRYECQECGYSNPDFRTSCANCGADFVLNERGVQTNGKVQPPKGTPFIVAVGVVLLGFGASISYQLWSLLSDSRCNWFTIAANSSVSKLVSGGLFYCIYEPKLYMAKAWALLQSEVPLNIGVFLDTAQAWQVFVCLGVSPLVLGLILLQGAWKTSRGDSYWFFFWT